MANSTGYTVSHGKLKNEVLEGADFCEHVTSDDLSKVVGYFYERDSFGLVAAYACCEDCRVKAKEAEGAEKVCCHDCKLTHVKRDTIEWRWYDFYAAQGDDPIVICNTCKLAEKHVNRCHNDQLNYDAEHGIQEEFEEEEEDPFEDDQDALQQWQDTSRGDM